MGQGIQDFYSAAKTHGFSRDYQLRVAQIGDLFQGPRSNLFVYAKTAKIPKRDITLINVHYKGFRYNVPMQVQYSSDSWPLTIYCDEAYTVRAEFETWQKRVFDEHTMQGKMENKIIQLNLLNDKTDTVGIYHLHGVIPQSIGEIQYDLSGDGKPLSFEVTFAYQYWTSQNVSMRYEEDLDLLGRITRVIQGIGVLGQSVNNVVKGVKNVGSILGI